MVARWVHSAHALDIINIVVLKRVGKRRSVGVTMGHGPAQREAATEVRKSVGTCSADAAVINSWINWVARTLVAYSRVHSCLILVEILQAICSPGQPRLCSSSLVWSATNFTGYLLRVLLMHPTDI